MAPAVPAELLQSDATPYRGLLEVRPAEEAPAHGRERRPPGGLPAGRGPERAVAPGLPADRGAEGAGGRGAHLRTLAPRRLFLEGLRRLRDALLPGLPGPVLGAPLDRPRGRGDEGDRRHVAGPGHPRLLHVDLRGAHRGRRRPSSTTTPRTCAGWPASRSARRATRCGRPPPRGGTSRAGRRPRATSPCWRPSGSSTPSTPRPRGSRESPRTPRCVPGPCGSRRPCTAAAATARSAAPSPVAPRSPGTSWPPRAGASGPSACSLRATRSISRRPRTRASWTAGSAKPSPCSSTRGWFRRRRTTRCAPTPR